MSEAMTTWGPAVGVLLFGLILGAFLLFRSRGEKKREEKSSTTDALIERRDLERSFDALIAELRELDDTSSKLAPVQREEERQRLERAAAVVLRDLDAIEPQLEAVDESVDEVLPVGNRALHRMVWLTSATVSLAVIYLLLLQFAVPRTNAASMTGNDPMAPASDPELAALEESVRLAPEDLNRRIELARAYLERRDMMAVNRETEYVLQRAPGNPRALSYQALVRLAMGDGDGALKLSKAALQSDPESLEAWTHMSIVLYQLGQRKAALEALDVAIQRHPENAQSLQALRREMEASADANTSSSPPSNAPATAANAPAESGLYSGRIELPATPVAPGAVVYVTLRPAGVSAGPPLAVKRLTLDAPTIPFAFSAADSMSGDPLPPSARIEARIDTDGDAMTRNATDPIAVVDNVKSGTNDLALKLR